MVDPAAGNSVSMEDCSLALSSVSDAVILVDDQGMISFMNDEASSVTGVPAEDAAGRDIWEVCNLIDQDTRESLSTRLGETKNSRTVVFPVSTSIISADGSEKLVRGALHLTGGPGARPVVRSIVFRDVSARWQIDIASQRAQKSEVLRLLVDGVAKNLDDLLTVVLAKLARIHTKQNDRPVVLRTIRETQVVIDRISSLVSSLSPQRQWRDTRKGISLVPNVISGTVNMLRSAFPEISVEVSYPDRTGYAGIPADLVEQLLMNLLLNASEAMDSRGTIRLTSCRVELEEQMKLIRAGNYVMLCVSDSGCGIREDDLLKVFDPFYSTKGKGRGLGLSSVYSIIHSNNGYIVLNSVPGQGTIISLFIPAARDISTESAGDFFPRTGVTGFQGSDGDLLLRILESTGCSVETLESGPSGSLFDPGANEGELDLVIMPGTMLRTMGARTDDWLPPRLRVMAIWDRDDEIPDDTRRQINIRGPLRIDCITEAVAAFFWHREQSCPPGPTAEE